jgi:hypothetical protein
VNPRHFTIDMPGSSSSQCSQVIHDCGQKGVTNDYFINSSDMLALRYNDRSHAREAFWLLLCQPDNNFLEHLPKVALTRAACSTAALLASHAVAIVVRCLLPRNERALSHSMLL